MKMPSVEAGASAHSEKERSYVASFDSSDVEACASEIADWIELR